jgi:hypothetical protein
MDLKTFVAESLTQILDGIREAQSRPGGEDVGADGYFPSAGNVSAQGDRGFFTNVDFDVSVIAETQAGGNSVRVADSQFTEGTTSVSSNTSRMKFSVHIRLPKGGESRVKPSSGRAYRSSSSDGW